MKQGILLFAHGARDPRWALPFEDVARRVSAQAPGMPVVLSFLEFMEPGLLAGGQSLAAAGCAQVQVMPLFLGAGGHVRKDLPVLMDALARQHPGVAWHLQPAIGEIDSVVEAMAHAVLAGARPCP
jgi:sirohydrochlorin cobaltochelatase